MRTQLNTLFTRRSPLAAVILHSLAYTALLFANSARAAAVFDNTAGASLGADPVSINGPLYDSFTSASSSQTLYGIELALSGPGGTGTLTVGLYADSHTSPGALITTLGTVNDSGISSGISDYTLTLTSTPVLSPSTRYWIGLSDSSGNEAWSYSGDLTGVGVVGEFSVSQGTVRFNGVNPSTAPHQMQVTYLASDPVPEGGTTTYVLIGFALSRVMVVLRRRIA